MCVCVGVCVYVGVASVIVSDRCHRFVASQARLIRGEVVCGIMSAMVVDVRVRPRLLAECIILKEYLAEARGRGRCLSVLVFVAIV